ncbi:hypothetical protein B0F90DRAFT_441288 [Multifurca ochricompacta]|uniref:Novel STAND NTPase 1 domain-containing protein n=1 Tax=Multifurca ochricompacta TaxID=376703 RepID=A0AAD4QET2_9AGAM|nr:hypothetical protein B0F90DRAFT_441288 [Multifurca ochricompacta]
MFSASAEDDQLKSASGTNLNPASSAKIGGRANVGMSAIQTSLAVLKEGSALGAKVPYLAPIAGLLLQALTMRDEVKQCKQEWEVLMQKLSNVASVIVDVAESCRAHDINEEELPIGLRAILDTLRSDLHEIKIALEECAETGGIRKVLLRTDILRKIKQYDGKLLNVLQTFQAKLALDSRFALVVQDRKITTTHVGSADAGQAEAITYISHEPSTPQIFFGRDAELAQIVHMIFTNLGSRPARIAILGPGGYGKTTLANAVLTHDRIQEQFGDARYLVSCESLLTSGALLTELGKSLGVLKSAPDALWSRIRTTLAAKESILCLDNFESPWDQPSEVKRLVEDLLSRITELRQVTIIITMRGTERPARTQWTLPPLAPLETLNHDASKEIWTRIAGGYDDYAGKLIKAVDHVPLAVNLLAHLAQVTPPALLWKDWTSKQLKAVQRGQMDRLESLEYSIQVSIDSGRMKLNPSAKGLLGVLSMLPDGIHMEQLDEFKHILVDMDIISCLHVLQQCSLINFMERRYQPHPIIRHFSNSQGFLSLKHKAFLEDFYITLASSKPYKAQPEQYAKMVLEVNNTKSILSNLLKSNHRNPEKLINAIITFTGFHRSIGDLSDTLIAQAVQSLQEGYGDASLLIRCLREWGNLHYYSRDMESAKQKMLEAEKLCLSMPKVNKHLHASILHELGRIYFLQSLLHEAEDTSQKALEIYQSLNDVIGQGNIHQHLAKVYRRMGKLDKGMASSQKALDCHKASNNSLGQGYSYQRIGEIQLKMGRLKEAEDSFQQALHFHQVANSILGQGNDYAGLSEVYEDQNNLSQSQISAQKALELYVSVNDSLGQGNAHRQLGNIYYRLGDLDKAEASYRKGLELHKAETNAIGQGNDFQGLGRVYMKRLQLQKAKDMFEKALKMHKQAQDRGGTKRDQQFLDQVLSQMGGST